MRLKSCPPPAGALCILGDICKDILLVSSGVKKFHGVISLPAFLMSRALKKNQGTHQVVFCLQMHGPREIRN